MTATRDFLQKALMSGEDVWSAGGASAEQIASLEAALRVNLPESYRSFLATVGALSIGDNTISGIIDEDPLSQGGGSLFGDTSRARKEQEMPAHLLVIQPDGDAPYCIDVSARTGANECPIVCFQPNTISAKRIADSFEQWYLTFFIGPA
jgi:hypothetical protein